jgi:hypothetical protein
MTRQAALHGWLAGTGIKSERQWPHLGQRWAVRPGCPPDGSIAATRSIVFSQRLHWGSSVEGADFMRDSLVRHLTYATVDFAHSTKFQIPHCHASAPTNPQPVHTMRGPKAGRGLHRPRGDRRVWCEGLAIFDKLHSRACGGQVIFYAFDLLRPGATTTTPSPSDGGIRPASCWSTPSRRPRTFMSLGPHFGNLCSSTRRGE